MAATTCRACPTPTEGGATGSGAGHRPCVAPTTRPGHATTQQPDTPVFRRNTGAGRTDRLDRTHRSASAADRRPITLGRPGGTAAPRALWAPGLALARHIGTGCARPQPRPGRARTARSSTACVTGPRGGEPQPTEPTPNPGQGRADLSGASPAGRSSPRKAPGRASCPRGRTRNPPRGARDTRGGVCIPALPTTDSRTGSARNRM